MPVVLLATGVAAQATSANARDVPVSVVRVQEQAIRQLLQLTGSVTSAQSARLSVATAGLVTALQVDAGSVVKAGDVLLQLDPALARWQWRSAQASAEAAAIAARDSQRRLQEARTLAPQMSIAETVVRDLEAEVAQDTAEAQQADAEAAYRKGILERHQLRAPFAGVVSAKLTELGEWIDPGQPVLNLVATEQLRIDFPVAEDYLAAVGPDTPVTYTLGDNSRDHRTGTVATIVPVSEPGARTFLLRVVARTPDARMIPGMSARGQLSLDAGRSAPVVPRDALLKYPDGRVVVWVVANGAEGPQVTETRVVTGVEFDGVVEIRSGLDAGAQVVVRGNEALQNGQRVVLLPAGPS